MKPTLKQQSEFDAFWAVYPRRIGKGAARVAWGKAVKLETPERITAAIASQVKAAVFTDMTFTPHPSTWLNQERWDDDILLAGGVDPRVKELADRWRAACRAGNDRAKAQAKADARAGGVSWELVSTEVTRQQKEEQ